MTLSFFICPFNLRVCGWVMHVMVASDILGVLSSMSYEVSFWKFSFLHLLILLSLIRRLFLLHKCTIFLSYLRSGTYVLGPISLHIIYIFLLLSFGTLNFFFYIHVYWVVCICHFLWSEVHSFLSKLFLNLDWPSSFSSTIFPCVLLFLP
jgi:hypothetical protein